MNYFIQAGSYVLVILAAVLIVFIGISLFSPHLAVYLLRACSYGKGKKPKHYADYQQKVRIQKNISYSSDFTNNRLDIYSPKENSQPKGTIFWVHGGFFVGGNKEKATYWSTMMASKGYTVVSIDYQVAPERIYPGPVQQMQDAYRFLKAKEQDYPMLDLARLVIGGDSAGAQLAAQFLTIQTNKDYAEALGLEQVVPIETIRAALLYCGPYHLQGILEVRDPARRFFMKRIGWAYLGRRNWENSLEAKQASIVEHISADYPPTFLTDGNTSSFDLHAKAFERALRANHVQVTTLYFTKKDGKIKHEYQFDLSTKQAMLAWEQTLAFLDEHILENTKKEKL